MFCLATPSLHQHLENVSKLGDNEAHHICFLSIRDNIPTLPVVQCLKTIFPYVVSSFVVVRDGTANSVPVTLCDQKQKSAIF